MKKSPGKKPAGSRTVLVGITASIAATRACDLILDLREKGVEVIPVLSRDAHHFVTPLAVQSLAAHEAYGDFFSLAGRAKPIHVELAGQADLILVAPASADIIARMSLGLADDLLSSIVLASDAPVVVAPAMNDKMYANPATQEHLERLIKRGFTIIEPKKGKLVCGGEAMGHIADSDSILEVVMRRLGGRRPAGRG